MASTTSMNFKRVELKQCPVCRKCFERKDTLRRHLQIHAANRPPPKQRKKACVPCFRSKIRCNGERPICSTCIKRSLSCAYDGDAETLRTNFADPSETLDLVTTSNTGSPPNGTAYESPDSIRTLPYEPFQQNQTSNFPNFSNFFPDTSPSSDYYRAYESVDTALSGFEWVFNDTFDSTVMQYPFTPCYPYTSISPMASVANSVRPTELISSELTHLDQTTNDHDQNVDSAVPLAPTEQLEDKNVPEDRWPMEWHAVPVQLHSIPTLGNIEGGTPVYSNHFDHPPITPEIRANLVTTLKLPIQRSPWQTVSLANFPSERTLDHCIDLYFVHFDKSVPVIHRPTFDPAQDLVLTLAIATIGSCYTGLDGALAFSSALSELTRRLLIFMAEYNPQFIRTGNYLTAQLLQGIHGLSSGSKRLFELSESNRGSLINNARNMGLFEMHPSANRVSTDGTLEHQWERWIRTERLRRIAWAIYLHDASGTYTRNIRPHVSLMEVRAMSLPSSADHWGADSPEAWAALHPWSPSMPVSLNFNDSLNGLLLGKDAVELGIRDDYQLHILLVTLVRQVWSSMELEFSAGGTLVNSPDGLNNRRETLHAAIKRFVYPLKQISRVPRQDGFESIVQRSCLAQLASILNSDDAVNYTHLVWRGGPTAGPTRKLLLHWASKNPQKVRHIARAAAFILNGTRQFPFNHYFEAQHAFHAGFLIWSMIPLLRSNQNNTLERLTVRPVCQLDWLGADDAPEGHIIANWLANGGPCMLRIHGIPDILGADGPQKVLQQTAAILKRMPVWGLAQVLRNAVLRALQAGEE